MELLEAVNTILPFMGIHTITRIETANHPTVDAIVSAIGRKTRMLLATGWWFNEHRAILQVETDGRITAPVDCIAIYCDYPKVSIEDGYLYNLTDNTRYFTASIDAKIIRKLEFHNLPEYAAQAVTYDAGIEVYSADLGMDDTLRILQSTSQLALVQLRREDLRNRDYNVHKRSSPSKFFRRR